MSPSSLTAPSPRRSTSACPLGVCTRTSSIRRVCGACVCVCGVCEWGEHRGGRLRGALMLSALDVTTGYKNQWARDDPAYLVLLSFWLFRKFPPLHPLGL